MRTSVSKTVSISESVYTSLRQRLRSATKSKMCLGGVTGGVAQSLVATAVGLVVAMFSLFAFNYFSRRLERLMDELESFANQRISEIRLSSEGKEVVP